MGALKQHFHEEICATPDGPSIHDLKAANNAAWDGYRALIEALPVWRTREQQAQIDAAQFDAEQTKWALDKATFWNRYYALR